MTYNVPPIQFLAGSRGGKYLCVVIQILDDFVAERQEEFGISFISSDESVAVIEGHSSITVLIEDDDGKQPDIFVAVKSTQTNLLYQTKSC